MSDRRVISAIVVLLILFLLYWFMPRPPEQRIVDKFENEQMPLIKKFISAETNRQRDDAAQALQKMMDEMPVSDQRQIVQVAQSKKDELEKTFLQHERERIAKFTRMTPEEQRIAIDKHIDEQETIGKLGAGQGRGAGLTGPKGGGGAQGGPGGDAGGNSGGAPPKEIPKGAARQMGYQQILDSTSPQLRAEVGDYMQQVEQRRMERGLSPYQSP